MDFSQDLGILIKKIFEKTSDSGLKTKNIALDVLGALDALGRYWSVLDVLDALGCSGRSRVLLERPGHPVRPRASRAP